MNVPLWHVHRRSVTVWRFAVRGAPHRLTAVYRGGAGVWLTAVTSSSNLPLLEPYRYLILPVPVPGPCHLHVAGARFKLKNSLKELEGL